ncbi:germinal-center associated nuclear protein, partial [Spea bombifrons]|uniref:germinal-center associated nuclear protein n=1 Tax=Spea bombifrons TaxID=233779 RepID=UPI00234A26FB
LGSSGQSAPAFGLGTSGQSAPAFGLGSSGQSAPAFGLGSSGQSAPAFGLGSSGQSAPAFGLGSSGQSTPAFGLGSSSQSAFGQSIAGQSAPVFGNIVNSQSGALLGQTTTQSTSAFGNVTTGQSAPLFGQATAGQSSFGQATIGQSAPAFGQTTAGVSAPTFGQGSVSQSALPFGQSITSQPASFIGQGPTSQTTSPFGQTTTSSSSIFGQASNSNSASLFGQTPTSQSTLLFGQATSSQVAPTFGQGSTSQSTSIFSPATTRMSASPFGVVMTSQSISSNSQNASQNTDTQSDSIFGRNATVFGQTISESPSESKQSPSRQMSLLGQGSVQGPLFGQTSSGQGFGFGKVSSSSQMPVFGQATGGQNFSFGQGTTAPSGQETSSQPSNFGTAISAQKTVFSQKSGNQTMFGKTVSGCDSVRESDQFLSGLPTSSAQDTSKQTSVFGTSDPKQSGTQLPFGGYEQHSVFGHGGISRKVPGLGESSVKSAFGPQTTSGQPAGVARTMDGQALMKTEPGSTESTITTTFASSTFAQTSNVSSLNTDNRFKPPAYSTFKPICGTVAAPEKKQGTDPTSFSFVSHAKGDTEDPSLSGNPGQSSEPSSFSSDYKNKGESSSSVPVFRNVASNFTSIVSPSSSAGVSDFLEDTRKEEPLKSFKRKDDRNHSPSRLETPTSEKSDISPGKKQSRHQLSGGANLLVRSLYDVVKSQMRPNQRNSKRDEATAGQPTEQEPSPSQSTVGKTEPVQQTSSKFQISAGPSQSAPSRHSSSAINYQTGARAFPTAGPSQPASNKFRPVQEDKTESADAAVFPPKTPLRRARRANSSTDSTGPLSPTELTAIQVKNLPQHLNDKQSLEKYFSKFGKVQRLYCKPGSKLAIVHFLTHTAAAQAKKMGKKLHREVSVFWHRKKTSPFKKESSSSKMTSQQENREESEMTTVSLQSSGRRFLSREPTASSGSKGSPHKKSLVTVQFDTDSADSPGPSSDTTGSSLPPSLSHLVGIVAESSEEKYRLLDQRDRILRQARVKRTELDQAKVFVGTCPDMCPEKERYMRDTRNQLSSFEYFPGTDKLDHAAAIKEYSRSSADQEEPLPHELRPAPVLNMTMNYLVTQIMDLGEDNYREWYDFVWNRTRGIRKDITQQHLCNLVTVSLMEKCMRFHIHCAHQMCEEPMSSFDTKINNENMTKCLQSLKEMYQDLQSRGVFCPNEPEFRGYSVLLNLNKGDILREIQQFHPSVRNSAEVKFAVQVFSALNSTNFVRFFKLVRSASYLNSCILHCYFNQIRRHAVRSLNVAYTASIQRTTLFPLDTMVHQLLFHDVNDAAQFLNSYGLSVFDGNVELNRAAFTEPEVPPSPKKCLFISQKRQVSVGEIVNGAPLPLFTLHHPVCSFDLQNKFTGGISIMDPGTRENQETPGDPEPENRGIVSEELTMKPLVALLPSTVESASVPIQTAFQTVFPPARTQSPPKVLYSEQDIAAVMEELVEDTLKELGDGLCEAAAAYIAFAAGESSILYDTLLTEVISEFSVKIAKEVVQAETESVKEEKRRQAEEARLKQERERLLTTISHLQCTELLNDVLTKCMYSISSETLQQALQLDHSARIARCSQEVCDGTVDRFLNDEIFLLARESLRQMHLYSKYTQRWKEVLASRKRLRRQMRGFPAAPGSVACSNTIKVLLPSAPFPPDDENLAKGFLDMGHAGKLSVSFTRLQQLQEQMFHKMKVQHFVQELLCDSAWTPLELPPLLVENLRALKNYIFWKMVLILPKSDEPNDPTSILCEWLKVKFYRMDSQLLQDQGQPVQTLALYSLLQPYKDHSVDVNVCVKVVQGPLKPSEMEQVEAQKQLLGTSALMLLLPTRTDVTDDDLYWITAILQLKQLLQAKPFCPPLPLAVLVPGQHQDLVSKVEEGLNLTDLVSHGLISEYIVILVPDTVNDMQGSYQVTSAVQFLLSNCPRSLDLCCLPLQQYIEDGVCCTFSKRFDHDVSERKKALLPSQDPAAIIDLYNYSISFLAEAVSSEHFCDLSWPVTEFTCPKGSSVMPHLGWNGPAHLSWLKKVLLSFQIPQMDKPPQGAPWPPVRDMILEYARQICRRQEAFPVLLSEVQCLLGRAYKSWQDGHNEPDGFGPAIQDIPWDNLIFLCINHRLRDWDSPAIINSSGSPEELLVYFLEGDLKKFTPPKTWENARLDTHKEALWTSDSGFPTRRQHSSKTDNAVRTLHFISEQNMDEGTQNKVTNIISALPQLKQSILAEKEENRRFEERLQHFIEEEQLDESVSDSLPLYLPDALLKSINILPNPSDGNQSSTSLLLSRESAACTSPVLRSFRDSDVGTSAMLDSGADGAAGLFQLSLTERMDQLQRLLKASQQEARADELHLSILLDLGEP